MNRRGEQGQATRSHIIVTATALFTASGYEDVSIESVLRAAGVSRGALYHHFAGKEALFTAVLEAVESRVAASVAQAAAGATDPLAMLRAGAGGWLRLAAEDAEVRRIVLLDAPAAVGWQTWREIDERYAFGMLKAVLGAGAQAGRIRADRVDLYAHVLLAVMVEVALLVARAEEPKAAIVAGQETIDAVIGSFAQPLRHA